MGSHTYLPDCTSAPAASIALDPVRQQELAAYLTHCYLQPLHIRLALLNAMSVCYKAQNLRSAAIFAQRLLETEPSDEYQDRMARQVLHDDATELNYDFTSPFVVCGATFVPIYIGQPAHIVLHNSFHLNRDRSVLSVSLQRLDLMDQACCALIHKSHDTFTFRQICRAQDKRYHSHS